MDYGKYFDALKRRNAALPDQSGVTKETYIRLIAKCLSEYGKVNDLRTATPDTVFSGLHAYSRIVTSMAAIVNYGKNPFSASPSAVCKPCFRSSPLPQGRNAA